MAASALHDRATERREAESPEMIANLLLACELTQHAQSDEILEKVNEIRDMKKSNVSDAAPHDTWQEKRIARRLGIRKYLKDAFDALISDIKEGLKKGGDVVNKAVDAVKAELRRANLDTDFIDNFAPPKMDIQMNYYKDHSFGFGHPKYAEARVPITLDTRGKAQINLYDFSMIFTVLGTANLEMTAVGKTLNVIQAKAHFSAVSQKIFGVPTELGSVASIISGVGQFVTNTINKVLLFLQKLKAQLDVYVKPAKAVVANISRALDTVTDVQETLSETTKVINKVLGMLKQGRLGDAILGPLSKYLGKALEPVEREIEKYFVRIKPTVLSFTGKAKQALVQVKKVQGPIKQGRDAAQQLLDMYDNTVEKIVGQVEGKTEVVTNVLTTKLLTIEDMHRIQKYSEGFQDVTEGAITMKALSDDIIRAKALTERRALTSKQDNFDFNDDTLVKVLGFEKADKYVMQTLTDVKKAIDGGDAYEALAKLEPSLLSTVSKQLVTVTEKLEKPLRAVRAFVRLTQNDPRAVEPLVKKSLEIARASLGTNPESQLAGIDRVKTFCKQHADEDVVGAVQGQTAQVISKFKSVLTTVDMYKRGHETLAWTVDTSNDVLQKIAPPLQRMCTDVNDVKSMSLEDKITLPLGELEVLLREALTHGNQLSVDYASQQSTSIRLPQRVKQFTKKYITPLLTALQPEKLPIQNMVDAVDKLNLFLNKASLLSENIKKYGEPGGSDFETFNRKFPQMMAKVDSLIKKFGGNKYAAKLEDVLKNFETMEKSAASWLAQIQKVIGDSTDVRGLLLSGSFNRFDNFLVSIIDYCTLLVVG